MTLGRIALVLLALALAAAVWFAVRSPVVTLNALILPGGHTLKPDVAYGTLPRQRLDIYRPTAEAPPLMPN